MSSAVRRWTPSARYTVRQRTWRPSPVGYPPRSRKLKTRSNSTCRSALLLTPSPYSAPSRYRDILRAVPDTKNLLLRLDPTLADHLKIVADVEARTVSD